MEFSGGVLATCSQTPGDGGDLVVSDGWRIRLDFCSVGNTLLKYDNPGPRENPGRDSSR